MPPSEIRHLGMPASSANDWILKLKQSPYSHYGLDTYNSGEAQQLLEQRCVEILDKPAALFFSKGMAAQFAVLKTAEEQQNVSTFILHPLSHIAWDEADSYQHLLQLKGIKLGQDKAPFTVSDLQSIEDPIATVVIELPLRRAGFRCLDWEELLAIKQWCHSNNVHFHLDGARLWEASHYYHKSEAKIAELFDSVYVSFYKGLGGLGGSMLLGETGFIEQCKLWRTRLAGDLFTAFPYILTALDGLDNYRPKLGSLVHRAKHLVRLLNDLDGLDVPEAHTNGFFIYLNGEQKKLNEKAKQLTQSTGLKLFRQVDVFPNSSQLIIEMQIGHQHEKITDQEILDYFERLLTLAGQ